jgi:3-oxoadipate enol-lactonase
MPFYRRPDGCRLNYELHGEGPALILLEGRGGDIPGWRRNIPHLAMGHRVIAYDFRGNGLSDPPRGRVALGMFAADTIGLLDHLGVETAHVYGQSFGGMVAIEMALTWPERVRTLVLAATHAGRRRALRVGPEARVPKDQPYLALYSARFAREHPEHVAEDTAVGGANPQPMHAGRRQWQALEAWDAWDRLGEIRCPTLILHGTDDRIVSPGNAPLLAGRIPGARLVMLEGAGHVYHSERAEEVDRIILEFLGEVEARP